MQNKTKNWQEEFDGKWKPDIKFKDRAEYNPAIKVLEEQKQFISTLLDEAEAQGRVKCLEQQEKKTAYDIVNLLDHLEMHQPEDLKTNNWRNWKYIRNSIVDKYDILDMWKNK